MEIRKKLKAVNSNYAIKCILKELDRLAETDSEKINIINNSIGNGWKGVFPLAKSISKRSEKEKPYITSEKSYSDRDLFDVFE